MKYDQDFIDRVLDRTDIVDLIRSYVDLKKDGKHFSCCCPFHDEKTPSFKVNPDKQTFHCFGGCSDGGNAITFEMAYNNLSFPEAIKSLARTAGVEIPKDPTYSEDGQRQRARAFSLCTQAESLYTQNLLTLSDDEDTKAFQAKLRDYLGDRGIGKTAAIDWGIGIAVNKWNQLSDSLGGYGNARDSAAAGLVVYQAKTEDTKARLYDFFREGVIFPIRDEKGRTVSFAKRKPPGADGPKYINGPETAIFKKSTTLYGLDKLLASDDKAREAIVVEGYMDVISCHSHGISNAVAGMGTAFTPEQINKLFRHVDHINFVFDGDKAGQNALKSAFESSLEIVNDNKTVSFVTLPAEHDPDSMLRSGGKGTFSSYLTAHKKSLSDYLTENSFGDLKTIESRSQSYRAAKVYLDKMLPSATKALLLQEVRDATGVNTHELLPLSVKLSADTGNKFNALEIEKKTSEFIAKEFGIDSVDVAIKVSSPSLRTMHNLPSPNLRGKSPSEEISLRTQLITSSLDMNVPASSTLTLSALVDKYRSGSVVERELAQAAIELYAGKHYSLQEVTYSLQRSLRGVVDRVQDLRNADRLKPEHLNYLKEWGGSAFVSCEPFIDFIEASNSSYCEELRTAVNEFKNDVKAEVMKWDSELQQSKNPTRSSSASYEHG